MLLTANLSIYNIGVQIPLMYLFPAYQCAIKGDDTYFECTRDQFCSNSNLLSKIDWTKEESIENFITAYGQACMDKEYLPMFSLGMLLCLGLTTLIMSRVSDVYSRKKVFIVSIFVPIPVLVFAIYA